MQKRYEVNKKLNVNQLVRAAMLIAVGIILPICFHTVKDAGQIFLPMHIPVLIGGFVLSAPYAALVGIITPIISSLFTGMPPVPFVYVMPIELAAYGFFISILYNKSKLGLYPSLIISMIFGRVISIAGKFVILHLLMGKPFSLDKVVAVLFVTGLPGIIIQLILIPILVAAIQKSFAKQNA